MLIYLASPFTNNDPIIRRQRYEAALKMVIRLTTHKILVYSPIVSCYFVEEGLPKQNLKWEYWQQLDRKMISRCDKVWVLRLDGWNESVGIAAEIEFAKSLLIPITYIDSDQTQFMC